jgi:hypothetical protein
MWETSVLDQWKRGWAGKWLRSDKEIRNTSMYSSSNNIALNYGRAWREDEAGGWRKPHNDSFITCMLRKILVGWTNERGWDRQVISTHSENMKSHLWYLVVDDKILLKWVLNGIWRYGMDSWVLRAQPISPNCRSCITFRRNVVFYGEELLAPPQTPWWRITPCRLSATTYLI